MARRSQSQSPRRCSLRNKNDQQVIDEAGGGNRTNAAVLRELEQLPGGMGKYSCPCGCRNTRVSEYAYPCHPPSQIQETFDYAGILTIAGSGQFSSLMLRVHTLRYPS